jgi:hypothetical protein
VTWVKAQLTDEQDRRVNVYAAEHELDKQEAVQDLIKLGLEQIDNA